MSSYDLMNNHLTTRSIRRRYYAITFLVWFATALPLSLAVLLAQSRGIGLAEVGLANQTRKAVSYTHLDVYKRQPHGIRRRELP